MIEDTTCSFRRFEGRSRGKRRGRKKKVINKVKDASPGQEK